MNTRTGLAPRTLPVHLMKMAAPLTVKHFVKSVCGREHTALRLNWIRVNVVHLICNRTISTRVLFYVCQHLVFYSPNDLIIAREKSQIL